MDQREQDILQKIEEKTKDIQIPENLEPDAVQKILENQGEEKRAERAKKKRRKIYRLMTVAAACFVAVLGFRFYLNRYVVQWDPSDEESFQAQQNVEVTISDDKQIAQAKEYEEAYAYLEAYSDRQEVYDTNYILEESADYGSSQVESAVRENSLYDTAASTEGAGSYSETNVRQDGVDEGDVVKTDGTYLYVLKDNEEEIAIVDATADAMKEIGTIEVEDLDTIREFYLDQDQKKLVVLGETYPNTTAITYDITDKSAPKEQGRITQNGLYLSSRKSGNYVYVFSDYQIYIDEAKVSEPETYIPMINHKIMPVEDIFLPSVSEACSYSVVTSIDITEPDKTFDSKAILSDGGEVYVSNENIYYYDTVWDYVNGEQTTIRRISYKDGVLEAGAQGKVDGYINDSYSIDEYDGYLRIVLTDGSVNDVRILNMDLEEVGAIENLAKDETVRSARLMGDTGYFVTFEQTDPLFSVDFSDPENPEIIGTLKIPGFSEYLHPYGDGKLLGIGMDADEETGITDGVKLTMFDISDPSDVKEEDTYILRNVYSTDVFYDYKAALVNAETNRIGFAGYTEGVQQYFLFSYDVDNGFICHLNEEINGNAMMNSRGIYIGDVLYVVQGNIIESYSLKDYQKIGDLIL